MNLRTGIKILVHLCRFALAALFILTAGAKLAILKKFYGKVAEHISTASIKKESRRWPADRRQRQGVDDCRGRAPRVFRIRRREPAGAVVADQGD